MKNSRSQPLRENTSTFIQFLIVFCVAYFLFFILLNENIERVEAVSPNEEARYTLDSYDIEALYNKKSKDKKEDLLILGYHQIREVDPSDTQKERLFITPPEIFEREMQFLRDHKYDVISLDEYLEYKSFKKFLKAGEKKVVITFDDGYISQFENAFPILKKYFFPATFFIYSDCIDKYDVCMTWDNLKELSSNNMKIANHSLRHLYLPELSSSDIRKEILENEIVLKNRLGEGSFQKAFAYPFGASNEKIENILRDLEYTVGVGVFPNFYKKDVGSLYLHRYLLGDRLQFFEELFQ